MNYTEAPRDDIEALRLFREHDSVGAESSLWLRVPRQLTKDGKPIGQIFVITIPTGNDMKMPIGMLTLTQNDRLVFWPVLPRRKTVVINKPGVDLPDHVTVEFPSERVHVTSYDSSGRAIHVSESWRSAPVIAPDLRLLFTFLVRMSVVTDQDVYVSRKFPVPQNDNDRRTAEIARSVSNFVMHDLPIPGDALLQHYAGFSLYRTSEVLTAQTLPTSLLSISAAHQLVKDWPANVEFPIVVTQFAIGSQGLCLAAGFPPGYLNDDLCFGFPQRIRNG